MLLRLLRLLEHLQCLKTDYSDYTNICPGTAQESGMQVLWEPSSQRWKKNIFLLNVVKQENTFHDPPSRDWKGFAITHKNDIFSPQKNCFVRRYVIGQNVQVKRVDAKLKESKKLVWGSIVNCIVYFKKQQVSLIMNQESTVILLY